jgi:MYXO-CTERM domain-containing protein
VRDLRSLIDSCIDLRIDLCIDLWPWARAVIVVAALCGSSRLAGAAGGEAASARSTPLVVDSCKGVADGALCTDGNPCTLGDTCVAGACIGTPAADGSACTDGNQCTAGDLCQAGVCKGAPVADGTACTDGEPCTDPDTCQRGRCIPGPPLVCDDGDTCTMDTCLLGDGCHHELIPSCSDAAVDATPSDGSTADGGADADAAVDGEAPDGADDLPPDVGFDTVGDEEAVDDSGVGAPRAYEARGGACVCSSAEAPSAATGWGAMIAACAVFLRRKRRAR